jgi:trans-aconitate 2-methyltransferase
VTWDPAQYEKFRGERSRPFFDLLARVPERAYARIADLGCGTGELTRALAERWPSARVLGVDRSPEMLAAAKPIPGRLAFAPGDVGRGEPAGSFDLLFSNAALHWVPGHDVLIPQLARRTSVLAVQLPAHFDSPAHRALVEQVGPLPMRTEPMADYVRWLRREGFEVDAWETVYGHVLADVAAVVEWMKGTALRPFLSKLDAPGQAAFLADYARRLEGKFADVDGGLLFPFRRLFFVASKR